MSIKRTKVFYPHIVKQYESISALVSENGYDDFYAAIRQEIADAGIDLSNEVVYKEQLSEDGFEGIVTVVFASQSDYDAYFAVASVNTFEGLAKPIFVEEVEDHII